MFNRILVVVDNSEDSKQVFEAALSLTKAANTRLMLLRVLLSKAKGYTETSQLSGLHARPTIHGEEPFRQQESQDDEARGWKLLRSLQAAARTVGITADLAHLLGDPAQVIYDQARRWGADLIIMKWQGLIGLNESVPDSVRNYVTHHAPYSVIILRHQVHSSPEVIPGNQVAAVR